MSRENLVNEEKASFTFDVTGRTAIVTCKTTVRDDSSHDFFIGYVIVD